MDDYRPGKRIKESYPGAEVILEMEIYKDTYKLKITPNGCVKTITACCDLTTDLGFNTDSKIPPTTKTKPKENKKSARGPLQ